MKNLFICLIFITSISGCSFSRDTPAPIVNATGASVTPNPQPKPSAVSTNKNSAVINKVDDEDNNEVTDNEAQLNQPIATKPQLANQPAALKNNDSWLMPTQGRVISPYTPQNKGIDIKANYGQDIVASKAGEVAYSDYTQEYGNLIIIKHTNGYLTAYAHNKVNLVKQGDKITRGQKIAEVGKNKAKQPILHFEIRQGGKPINPKGLLEY